MAARIQSLFSSLASSTATVARQVYLKEKLAPPSLANYAQAQKELFQISHGLISTPFYKYTVMQLLRSGLLVAEIYGFFVVGEVIGRGQLVGYKH